MVGSVGAPRNPTSPHHASALVACLVGAVVWSCSARDMRWLRRGRKAEGDRMAIGTDLPSFGTADPKPCGKAKEGWWHLERPRRNCVSPKACRSCIREAHMWMFWNTTTTVTFYHGPCPTIRAGACSWNVLTMYGRGDDTRTCSWSGDTWFAQWYKMC